jgi:hypothetical protein
MSYSGGRFEEFSGFAVATAGGLASRAASFVGLAVARALKIDPVKIISGLAG